MASIRVSEAEAVRDFAALLAKVRGGAEIVIEHGADPVAIVRTLGPSSRSIEECIARLPVASVAIVGEGFARDVEIAVSAHREPLDAPAWD